MSMRKVRLTISGIVDVDSGAPVLCWRGVKDSTNCSQSCAAFHISGKTVHCLAMPDESFFAELSKVNHDV